MSDRILRRTYIVAISMVFFGIGALPLLLWLSGGTLAAIISVQLLFAVMISVLCGIAPALFVELFPTEDRLSGYSVAYNVGLGVVGGSTPMICTWLISVSGHRLILAALMIVVALIGIGSVLWVKDRSREPLR